MSEHLGLLLTEGSIVDTIKQYIEATGMYGVCIPVPIILATLYLAITNAINSINNSQSKLK